MLDMMMLANFIDLCLYGIISDKTVNQFNNLMTFMLFGEIGMKLFGYGASNFLSIILYFFFILFRKFCKICC